MQAGGGFGKAMFRKTGKQGGHHGTAHCPGTNPPGTNEQRGDDDGAGDHAVGKHYFGEAVVYAQAEACGAFRRAERCRVDEVSQGPEHQAGYGTKRRGGHREGETPEWRLFTHVLQRNVHNDASQ